MYYKLYVDGTNSFFTYEDKDNNYKIGDRVAVYFRNKEVGGLIVKEDKSSDFQFKINSILRKLENEISLSEEYINLLLWMSEYYLSPFNQVLSAALPKELKIKYNEIYKLNLEEVRELSFEEKEVVDYFLEKQRVTKPTLRKQFSNDEIKEFLREGYLILDEAKKISYDFNKGLKKREINLKLFNYFLEKTCISKNNLFSKFDEKLIKKLVLKKYLSYEKNINEKDMSYDYLVEEEINDNVNLTSLQQSVCKEIEEASINYHLIKGITGSGKTEVYINLIKSALRKNMGSIFLVPEISLTPQMVARFKKEFKEGIAVLHSNITDKEKKEEWLKIQNGDKKIVLGARSAIFAPVKNLKYIIIDEEHENTYKQDTNPRYNAKFVALKRSQLENAKVILGSATPSVESYYYAEKGIFNLITMNERYNNATLPEIKLIDMKQEESSLFSETLLKNIRETLLRKEQVIVLLNRKGYATMVQCKDCGHIEECEHCSIKLSYYAGINKLKCNYCGREHRFFNKCSKCGSENLGFGGKGTEQIEEKLKEYFNVPIIRVDSESTRKKSSYENIYFDFLNHKYDIMIGTQMIAKGLHFPNVTLVGVINGDLVLNFPDFRASEKTYQLITQVAGRAGRGDKKGKVLIQTYQPENFVMENILKNDFDSFYKAEIELREVLDYPPFSKIINIGLSHTDEYTLKKVADSLYSEIKSKEVDVYSPNKSLVYRVKDRFRQNIFIKGKKKNIDKFKRYLNEVLSKFDNKNCRITVDVDPLNLI